MFAPLQMQSLLLPLLPPSAVQPVEPPSLLRLCPPRRGSEFMLPSRFHPRFGDLPNANANALLPPRLETCRRYPNLRFIPCGPRPELQLTSRRPPNESGHTHRCLLQPTLWPRLTCHLTSFPRPHVTILLSPIGPQGLFIICMHITILILSTDSYTHSLIPGSICCILFA